MPYVPGRVTPAMHHRKKALAEFIKEECLVDRAAYVPISQFAKAYEEWAARKGKMSISSVAMGRVMATANFDGVRFWTSRIMHNGKQVRCYIGLELMY